MLAQRAGLCCCSPHFADETTGLDKHLRNLAGAELGFEDRLLALEATGLTTVSAALQNDLGAAYTESLVAEGPFRVVICQPAAQQSL